MIIKPPFSSTVYVNYWPGIDLDKVKAIEKTDKVLYDKINSVFGRVKKSITLQATGRNPDMGLILSQAKNYVDRNLGVFDLNEQLNLI